MMKKAAMAGLGAVALVLPGVAAAQQVYVPTPYRQIQCYDQRRGDYDREQGGRWGG